MKTSSKIKITFDIESNPVFSSLIDEIIKNNLSRLTSYTSWRDYFSKYIDPEVIHRKKDIKEFEEKFNADFFEILHAIHMLVYLFGKKVLETIQIPPLLVDDLYEDIFEQSIDSLPKETKENIEKQITVMYEDIHSSKKITTSYDLLENIYRVIVPKEIRKPLGEYFTPLALAEKMVSEVPDTYHTGLWMDNSSGFSVFLLAYLRKFGISNSNRFICIETNPLSVFVAKVIILHEFKDDLDSIPELLIFWGDSLLNERYCYKNDAIETVDSFEKYFGKIDVVIGNPPWVSWKSMTKEYQKQIGDNWRSYDIFEKNITRNTLGACNDDISSYFVYYSIDTFLKDSGYIKFVTNLSLFKSNLVGKEFRHFFIRKNNVHFKLLKIYDLSGYKIFPGITNAYCIFDALKGAKTTYPIPYIVVTSKQSGVSEEYETTARPVSNKDGGAIITVNGNENTFDAIEGLCEYKARAGVCTWLNSAYWVKKLDDTDSTIVNLANSGKKKLREITTQVEPTLLYRLLRARNLKDYKPIIENHILVPQLKTELSKAIGEDELRNEFPLAFNYFSNFKEELSARSGYSKFLKNQPFYALYNIGPYTTAPIKLGWQFVSNNFRVYLLDNAADIIPDLNVMFIPLTDLDEAYYLHALLNSTYAKTKIEASSNWTFPSGSIQKVYLEKFDINDALHKKISTLQKAIMLHKKTGLNKKMDKYFQEYWFSGRVKKTNTVKAQLALV